MEIIIDYREDALLTSIENLISLQKSSGKLKIPVSVEKKNLDIGDIEIRCDGELYLLIERKTLSDLESSIRDGRYNEQSLRLNASTMHNHNIVYIIEGNLTNFKPRNMEKSTFYSCMFSLHFYKGFSVMRTNDVNETTQYILNSAMKISRENKKKGFYLYDELQKPELNTDYEKVIQTKKKSNITNENINIIMLSQIPNISVNLAKEILLEYKSIYNLVDKIRENKECINSFTYKNAKGQTKKLNKTCIKNIHELLIK